MERLPNAEKTICGGKSENGFNSKLLKFAGSERKKMKARKEEPARKSELGLDRLRDAGEGSMEAALLGRIGVGAARSVAVRRRGSKAEEQGGREDEEEGGRGNGEIVSDTWKTR
ncbi:putative histone-lysine N-methyltransferase ATXR3 [Sesbania bispinosa]|nr:putative histone-lysine N-methyltransferase ATXR3 [Sesbania bispinosa]